MGTVRFINKIMGKQPKTRAQKDRETDLRLLRIYGVGLDWYDSQFEKQGKGCAVCGDGPKTRRLHVDHDHKWKYIKILSLKQPSEWISWADYNEILYSATGDTKKEALAAVRQQLKTASVRGLLCHRCNRAMILFKDRPNLLREAAEYLERFQK